MDCGSASTETAARRQAAMVSPGAPIGTIPFLLLAACGAFCQLQPHADRLQRSHIDIPKPPEMRCQEMRAWKSLPDAPAPMQPSTQGEIAHPFVEEVHDTGPGEVPPPAQPSFTSPYQLRFTPTESTNFFTKYLFSPTLNTAQNYHPSTSGSFLGRVTYAASSIFINHDSSGRERLNTPMLFGLITMAAAHTAYRPYWEQSPSTAFNDFGASMGSNAGMNVYNEFRPDIQDRVKGLTPKFVSRFEERILHGQTPRDSLSTPAQ